MEKIIHAVTNGEYEKRVDNPGLSGKGWLQIYEARKLLPWKRDDILELAQNPKYALVCGIGRRHIETARTLSLLPRINVVYNGIIGDSIVPHFSKYPPHDMDNDYLRLFFKGIAYPFILKEEHITYQFTDPLIPGFVASLENNAIMCCSRRVLTVLGEENVNWGTVYRITIENNEKITSIQEL